MYGLEKHLKLNVTPFSVVVIVLIAYQYWVIDLILFYSFLRLLAMLILVQKENEQNKDNIFQDTYPESSYIRQLAIMYHFEHTNHDIDFFSDNDVSLNFSKSSMHSYG